MRVFPVWKVWGKGNCVVEAKGAPICSETTRDANEPHCTALHWVCTGCTRSCGTAHGTWLHELRERAYAHIRISWRQRQTMQGIDKGVDSKLSREGPYGLPTSFYERM